ncbi:hypothetical protein ACFSUJ_17495 [Streptomyces lusitanus]|uniref:Transposase n=1 Tax=Streptomyces lusitanus TaxID=68232 RepID=A0ABU3K1H7_9ACTN|nr:hypothetical protein [Streptomyces lusitanus]
MHAVVESALGIDDGFRGATARGATFQGFELVTLGRHRRSGTKVLRRGGDALMDAELCDGEPIWRWGVDSWGRPGARAARPEA